MLKRFLSTNDYDSVLYAPNFRNISALQILLRVHLNPFNPGVAGATEERIMDSGRLYTFQTWKPAEWQTFQVEFKRDVENYFNYPHMELWLLPTPLERLPDAAAEMRGLMHVKPLSARFNPVVQCGLSVTIVPTAAASHVSFDVLRLKDDQPDFRSYVRRRRNARDGGMLDHRDIDLWSKPRSSGVPHNSAAHEVGHVLGLGHINRNHPQCVGGNEPICYGRRGTPQHRNLMGGGNDVTTANARPWLRSIFRHSESLVWAPTTDTPKEAHFLQ